MQHKLIAVHQAMLQVAVDLFTAWFDFSFICNLQIGGAESWPLKALSVVWYNRSVCSESDTAVHPDPQICWAFHANCYPSQTCTTQHEFRTLSAVINTHPR